MKETLAYLLSTADNPPVGWSARRNIPPQCAAELVDYCPDTGLFWWRPRPPELFDNSKGYADRVCKTWNAKNAGKPAFTAVGSYGYLYGRVFCMCVAAHQMAWVCITGAWPTHQIDHINGIYADNRASNLREVTHAENGRNQKRRATNTSGVTGVTYSNRDRMWIAQITFENTNHRLGMRKSFAEAVELRREAEKRLGFHANHGKARDK